MVYTHNYWDVFCDRILQKKLHHGPTKGGKTESVRFEDQYEYTLNFYQQEFDRPSPKNIWPDSKMRFTRPMQERKINLGDYWLFPKPKAILQKTQYLWFIPPLLFLSACGKENTLSMFVVTPDKMFFTVVYVIASVIFSSIRKKGCFGNFFLCGIFAWIYHDMDHLDLFQESVKSIQPWMVWLFWWFVAAIISFGGKNSGYGCSGCSGCGGCGD